MKKLLKRIHCLLMLGHIWDYPGTLIYRKCQVCGREEHWRKGIWYSPK